MASSKQEGTSAAAEQLGSMSLGESVERKDDDAEPTARNGTTSAAKVCSACEKKSDALMKCRACKCVWYCDKKCQNKHWKEHKKECKSIKEVLDKRGGKLDVGTELDIGPLEKLPPREECPICMHVLPFHDNLHTYFSCCGKVVCCGCDYQHQIKSKGQVSCAFCREPKPRSDEETLARTRKRAELKDPNALCNLAMKYGSGKNGLPVDEVKCIELLRESADLGFPGAQYNLGNFHCNGHMGLEQNEEEELKYIKEAAEGGDFPSLHNLGWMENDNGNRTVAMQHWRLTASGGLKESNHDLIEHCFEKGLLHHGDLAETLQAFYLARAELKSNGRDQYIKYLKNTGKYKEEYDC